MTDPSSDERSGNAHIPTTAPVTDAFVQAGREVLTGLHNVVVSRQVLHDAPVAGGMPCTLDDIKLRFGHHLAALAHGKEPAKVRVLVE
jgi:hypothetical protein